MKRLILILLILFVVSYDTYSQLKFFLPDSNAYFSVSPYKFWFQGDTIIGNKKYIKVFIQNGDSIPDFKKAVYYAAVREDTLAEKIFCLQKDDGVERLISNFLLSPGDTTSVYSFWPGVWEPIEITFKVISIDSIQIQNKYRKKVNFEHEMFSRKITESWIEGIGSTDGLFFPGAFLFSIESDKPNLLCVHINDTLVYQNPTYQNCYIDFQVGINEHRIFNFDIYPSLVKNILYLKFQEGNQFKDSAKYQITDMQGRSVSIGYLTNNSIDVSKLPNGLYLFKIKFTNAGLSTVKKFNKY
jgi:hypothetical protein